MSRLTGIICLLLFMSAGCVDKEQRELTKWNVSLDKDDKRPYGAYLAYQSLSYFFPEAKIKPLIHGARFEDMDDEMMHNDSGRSLLIFEGLDFYLSDKEWDKLKEFIGNGNDVMIFCSRLDSRIEQELNCYKIAGREEYSLAYLADIDKGNEHVLSIGKDTSVKFGYKGRWLQGYFYQSDTTETNGAEETTEADKGGAAKDNQNGGDNVYNANDTGANTTDNIHKSSDVAAKKPLFMPYGYANGQPDLVGYKRGEGHLLLHAAPLTLSNYFLLQPGNEQYLSDVWSLLPSGITKIYWNDYYKRTSEASSLRVLFKYPATRLALQLALLALILYILFEGKRKQRVIPIMPPLKNESVSFVETVGRLYYNKGNHVNLANKMIQQFLEWVRTYYFLNTNLLDEHFIRQLSIKSGQPEPAVRALVEMIHEIKGGNTTIDEAYLYQLYNTIQQFYKNHPVLNGTNRTGAYSGS